MFFIAGLLLIISCTGTIDQQLIELKTASFRASIDNNGYFSQFLDIKSGKNYIAKDTSVAVMSIRLGNVITPPHVAEIKAQILTLKYPGGIEANIKVEQKSSHLSFELLTITNNETIELIIWGPYATSINKIIGETVGVVRGEEYAIGIQALNIKTLGGYPWHESDRMPWRNLLR